MNPRPKKAKKVTDSAEPLRIELQRRQHELDEYRRHMGQLEGLFAHVADAIFVGEPDGRIVDVNPAACELLGYSREELLGMRPWDFITNLSQEIILGQFKHLRTGIPVTLRRTYRRKDGSLLEMEVRLARFSCAAGDFIIVSSRDITEHIRLEERLRRSEKNLAEGQRLTKTGSWILDFKTGNTDWSVETCRIFGFPNPPPSPHYSEFRKRVRPEDREGVDRGLRESFETGEPRPLNYIFILPDGTRKNIETISQPVRDEEGKLKLMGTVMDVTERVLAQEELQKSEDYLSEAQSLSHTGSFSWKPASGEVSWSAEMFRIFGFDPGVKPSLELARQRIHPDDAGIFTDNVRYGLQEGRDLEYEHRLLMPDGSVKTVQVFSRATRDESGKVEYIGAVMDITERKKAAEALRASELLARGQLDALIRTLDSLAGESDPDNLPKHVLNTIHKQLGAHSVTAWERNGDALDLLGVIEDGRFQTRSETHYFEGSIPVTGHAPPLWVEALRTGMHTVIEDIDKEPCRIILADGRFAEWRATDLTRPFAHLKIHFARQNIRGLLISPMMLAGRLEGIIGIRFTGTRVFGPTEIDLMKALAHQAMLVMRLTHLSAQSRQAAVMAERNRLARDIHDTLAQGFTGVIMQLEAAKGAAARDELAVAAEHIKRADDLARLSLGEARRSVRALRPRSLREGNLCMAMEDLLKRMSDGTELRAEFNAGGDERVIPRDWEEGLLRIAQESLTNTIKHAKAANFRANLRFGPEKIQLQLADDGRGFDPQAENEGFGLIGMKERIDQMGGKFILRSKPGQGTEILVILNNPAMPKPENGNEQT